MALLAPMLTAVRGIVIGALIIAGIFAFRSTGCSGTGCSADCRRGRVDNHF